MEKARHQDTWTVVCFLEEFTVEAVPTKWIVGDLCYFPVSTKEKIASAIAKNETVNFDWPTHKIRTFRNGTYENYALARQKAKVAEDTSDLNSDMEVSSNKRKRFKKIMPGLSDSDSDQEPVAKKLPPPPKLPVFNIAKPSTSGAQINTVPLTVYDDEEGDDASSSAISNNLCEMKDQTKTNDPCNNLCKKCCRQLNICDIRIRNITTQCHIIRNLVSDISAEVKDMNKNKSYQTKPPIDEAPEVTFFESLGLNFPLDNSEDLTKFENYLSSKENFVLAAKEIARCGGNTSYDFIKRAMTPIISNNLAREFNWEGKKKKRKFSELNLAKLIIDADKRAKVSTTQKECERSIVGWLKRAKEREERVSKKF